MPMRPPCPRAPTSHMSAGSVNFDQLLTRVARDHPLPQRHIGERCPHIVDHRRQHLAGQATRPWSSPRATVSRGASDSTAALLQATTSK